MNARACPALAACVLLLGCVADKQIGSDCGSPAACADALEESNAITPQPDIEFNVDRGGNVDKADVLFVVDDSSSMAQAQAALAEVQPRLLTALVRGDADGAGAPEFSPVKDLHIGVISTNLGAGELGDQSACAGLGDDAVLLDSGCTADGARFATMTSTDDLARVANEVSCMVQLGTGGCEFQQPLEAPLKALWYGTSLTFGDGSHGHGRDANAGFLRADSLLIIVVISAEDDCSTADPRLFASNAALDPSDPDDAALLNAGPNVRCHDFAERLQPVAHYIESLTALRAVVDLAMFFAIAGYPVERVSAEALASGSLEIEDQRNAFYDGILADPAMAERVDDQGTQDVNDDTLMPVCGNARPGRRLLEVARGFESNGLVQSICNPDMGSVVDAIMRSVARRIGPPSI